MVKGTRFSLHKEEVIASRGVISTNHPLASAAGVEAYGHGGNAFDAAIASLFALTVVEPMMVSVFGAGFFVVRDGNTGKVETIDNYAVAPFAATDDMYEMVKERKPGQNIFEIVGRKNQERARVNVNRWSARSDCSKRTKIMTQTQARQRIIKKG